MTAPDLDALVARINALADCSYWANAGWDIPGDATQVIGRLAVRAAAAITELRAEVAQLNKLLDEFQDPVWQERAEQAEAEVAQLNSGLDMVAEERDVFQKSALYWVASASDEKHRAERAEAEVARLKADVIEWQDCALVMRTERDALALQVKMRPLPEVREDKSLIRPNEELRADIERYVQRDTARVGEMEALLAVVRAADARSANRHWLCKARGRVRRCPCAAQMKYGKFFYHAFLACTIVWLLLLGWCLWTL